MSTEHPYHSLFLFDLDTKLTHLGTITYNKWDDIATRWARPGCLAYPCIPKPSICGGDSIGRGVWKLEAHRVTMRSCLAGSASKSETAGGLLMFY